MNKHYKKILNILFSQPVSGFTLVELLVVVALVGILGTITTQVFIMGMQAQNKTEIIKEVKQNGDYALGLMEVMIRNAVDIKVSDIDCNTNKNSLTILNQDGLTTTFECSQNPQPTPNNIASVSGIFVPVAQPTPTGMPLTGSKVSISNCTFRVVCPNPPTSPKYVYVGFTVNQVNQPGTTPTAQNRAVLDYQTTVTLRNYQQ